LKFKFLELVGSRTRDRVLKTKKPHTVMETPYVPYSSHLE
jgi:hypothetical protein